MTETTPNLRLPYIMAAQAQKHVTHNEAIRALDAIVQLAVIDRDLTSPPPSPDNGDRYIVATSATDEWEDQDRNIAAYQDGAWTFYAPHTGWIVWVADEDTLLAWDGENWTEGSTRVNPTPLVGINTTADSVTRLAVKSDAALFNHDDVTPGSGDMRVKINKDGSGDTASLLFQTAASGRAEIGTAGDDKLAFKVSSDGTSWSQPLTVDHTTGNIGIRNASPQARLDIKTQFGSGVRVGATNTYTTLWHFDGGTGSLDALFDYDVIPGSETASAEIRYFRGTNTTGNVGVRILRGNNTSSANTYLAANSDGYLHAQVGNLGIGTSSPTTKLHVNGPVRIGSFPVAGLPSASSVGAGTIAYVSNEAGGATLAFSDGSNWRRCTDRAIVS